MSRIGWWWLTCGVPHRGRGGNGNCLARHCCPWGQPPGNGCPAAAFPAHQPHAHRPPSPRPCCINIARPSPRPAAGEFMLARYREVCDTVLRFCESKEKVVRRAVMALIPRLAAFAPERFARSYLDISTRHLLAVLAVPQERGAGGFYRGPGGPSACSKGWGASCLHAGCSCRALQEGRGPAAPRHLTAAAAVAVLRRRHAQHTAAATCWRRADGGGGDGDSAGAGGRGGAHGPLPAAPSGADSGLPGLAGQGQGAVPRGAGGAWWRACVVWWWCVCVWKGAGLGANCLTARLLSIA